MADAAQTPEATEPALVDYGAMSQADYQAARAAGPLVAPVDPAESAAPPTETPADQAPVDDAPAPAEADEDETPATPRLQKRINALTRQRKEAEAAAQTERDARLALEARLLALEQRGEQQPPQQADSVETGPPHPDNYETNDAYMLALGRYTAQEAIQADRQQAAQQAQLAQRQAQLTAARSQFAASIEAARAAYDDFDDVVQNTTVSPAPLVSKALAYTESAGHLGYYLCANPDEMTRLNGITDATKVLVELGRLAAQVVSPVVPNDSAPDPPPVSAAPPPVTPPVGDRSGGGVPKDPTSSQEAWQAWRRAGGGRPTG